MMPTLVKTLWKNKKIASVLLSIIIFFGISTVNLLWEKIVEDPVEDTAIQIKTAVAGNVSTESLNEASAPTPAISPTNPCPSGPPSRLNAGDKAIQLKPGHINLRSEPNPANDENIIGEIEKCEFLTILEGPTCGDGYNFYRVRHGKLGEGWATEANKDPEKYWLVKVLDGKQCYLPPIFVEGEIAISDHPNVGFVRAEPDLSTPSLQWNIEKGDIVTIQDGPVCNDTFIWYEVYGDKNAEPGWTELGRGNDYFFDIPERFAETNVEDADASC